MRGTVLALAVAIVVPAALVHAGDDDDNDAGQAQKKPKKKFARHHDDDDDDTDASAGSGSGSGSDNVASGSATQPQPDDTGDGGSITGDEKPKHKKKHKKKKSEDADRATAQPSPAAATPPPAAASETAMASTSTKRPAGDPISAHAMVGVAAHDIEPARVQLAGELLGAGPVDGGNRALYGIGGGLGLGAAIYINELLDVHAGGELVYLSSKGMGSTTNVVGMVGPRVHLAQYVYGRGTHHDAWLDAHVRYGSSGGVARPGFDVGGAFEWEVSHALRLGPVVRYEFGSDPRSQNAQLFTIGLAVSYLGTTRVATHAQGDRDGDGVADDVDRCPDQPAGKFPDANKPGCPSDDRDGDGLRDADDMCPDKPAGKKPDPSRPGCPFEDRDGDNIADADDKCPDQPGPPNPFDPSKHGCPVLAKVVENKIEILQEIFFETDSATIKSESIPVLQAVADIMKKLGDARVRVEGHTDQQGTDEYNLELSKRRARAVAQWLIENGGIGAKRLETEGYGRSRPKVSGPADNAQNRRVEFVILDGN